MKAVPRIWIVVAIGLIIGSGVALRSLVAEGFDPSVNIKFGELSVEQTEYGRRQLGEIVVADFAGHDGKYFFIQAMDPLYLDAGNHASYLDRPTYRAQRMLYPALASGLGVLSPRATAWGLIVVNVVALVVGTYATARLAVRMGLTEYHGLAFPLNIAMLVALNIDGANLVALALLMVGVLAVESRRPGWAAVALAGSALARETMLIGAIGLFAFWWYRNRQVKWVLLSPVVPVGAWWVYVRWRIDEVVVQDIHALDVPFKGLIEAAQIWRGGPEYLVDALVAAVLLYVMIALVVRSIKTPTAIGWAASGFAILGIALSWPVWLKYFDATRAVAPVLTAYLLVLPAANRRSAEKASGELAAPSPSRS